MDIAQIAQLCHEVNKAYCDGIDDPSQKSWDEAEQWQRDSAIKGVQYAIDNPDATPESQHEAWSKDKYADGWKYGPEKNPEIKAHPCLVPYNELPIMQKVKDYLFQAVVKTCLTF